MAGRQLWGKLGEYSVNIFDIECRMGPAMRKGFTQERTTLKRDMEGTSSVSRDKAMAVTWPNHSVDVVFLHDCCFVYETCGLGPRPRELAYDRFVGTSEQFRFLRQPSKYW